DRHTTLPKETHAPRSGDAVGALAGVPGAGFRAGKRLRLARCLPVRGFERSGDGRRRHPADRLRQRGRRHRVRERGHDRPGRLSGGGLPAAGSAANPGGEGL
ncbi:MAG: hypothetical protein AVDCRST_MAG05-2651, partial [uncultured Rubrobacteraceae bacterium]